jgi:hypothetical protein
MASRKQGVVTVRGRFPKGTRVQVFKVEDGALRAEGDPVDVVTAGDDGVKVSTERDQRYIVRGVVNGAPVELRVRGRGSEGGDEFEQQPVTRDRTRMSDGSWSDEAPKKRDAPAREAAPHLGMDQVAEDTPLRAGGDRGEAHVVDPEQDQPPYGRQEDVDESTPQMLDVDTGKATPVVPSVQRQEDAPEGMWQRVTGDTGQAFPVPSGSAERSQEEKESSRAKESRGEPVRAAAEPMKPAGGTRAAKNPAEEPSKRQARERERTAREIREAEPEGTPAVENLGGSEKK